LTADLPGLLRIENNQAQSTIRMLARAFENYPLLTCFFPDKSQRRVVCENMLAFPVYTCLRYGEVYSTSTNLEGAAVWTRSEDYPVGFWRLVRILPWRYILGVTLNGSAQLQNVDRLLNDIHKRLVPYSHLYLEILGVDPPYQKQGFSSRLVKPMIERLSREQMDCYLETQDPQDVPIYQHLGFKVIEQTPIPKTPLYSWAMLLEAAKDK
jgi:GNAT superfamily N-acetyltransferase